LTKPVLSLIIRAQTNKEENTMTIYEIFYYDPTTGEDESEFGPITKVQEMLSDSSIKVWWYDIAD
jgi:hypothetical protein